MKKHAMKGWLGILATLMLITAVVGLAACSKGVPQVSPADFYKDKEVHIDVGASAGGGMDATARLLAPYLQKEIGARSVVIDNRPGGDGLVSANWMYLSAPKDGSTIANLNGTMLLQNEGFGIWEQVKTNEFKSVSDFPVIGIWGQPTSIICMAPNSPIKTLKDLKGSTYAFKSGTADPTGNYARNNATVAEALGLPNMKIIPGYPGTAEMDAAVFRGELDFCASQFDLVTSKAAKGMFVPIGVLGRQRLAPFPDLPTVFEVGVVPGTEDLVDLVDQIMAAQRLFAGPPGMPADRVKFLADAYERIIKNPEVLKAFEAKNTLIWNPKVGTDATNTIKNILGVAQKNKDRLLNLMQVKYAKK